MRVTYEDIKSNPEIRTYITQADASLIALGFTEHSFAHVTKCAETASSLLRDLGRSNSPKSPASCTTSATSSTATTTPSPAR